MSITELCSIDSWLWQFVVEEELFNKKPQYKYIDMWKKHICPRRYSYRLMISSIQEDKEKFILDNIVLK